VVLSQIDVGIYAYSYFDTIMKIFTFAVTFILWLTICERILGRGTNQITIERSFGRL
jgi:hypothetical protein